MLYSHIIDSKNCVINKENLFFLSKLMNEAILRKIINDRALCKEIIYISEKEVNFFPDHMFFLKYLCDKYFNIYVYYNVGKLENLFLKDESNNIIVYQEKNTNENVVINRIRNIVTINISYNIHHVFDLLCYVTYKLKELELNTEIISNHASSVFYKIRYIEKKRICEDIFYKYLSYYDLDYFIFINCLENKSEQTVKFDKLNPDNNVEINFSRDSIVVTLNCNLKITYNINLSKYKGELELISKIILGIFLSLL